LSQLAGTLWASTLALGYRWDRVFLGATVLGGLGLPEPNSEVDVCRLEGMSCLSASFRYGVQARYYHRLAKSQLRPWFGVGVAAELFELVNLSRAPDAMYAYGNQFNLRLGLDVATRSASMAGSFFLDYAVGRFAGGTVTTYRVQPIDESRDVHHWILFAAGLSWRP
jgi:hypothetical protein